MSNSIKKMTIFVVLLLFITGIFINASIALGVALGAGWGILNLFFLKQVMKTLLLETENKNAKLALFALIKFPLLYLAGYGLLSIKGLSPFALLIGFTLTLAGTLVKSCLKLECKGMVK